jgi:hypothetical protein
MKKPVFFLISFLSFIRFDAYGNEPSSQLKSINEKRPHHVYLGPEVFLFDLNMHVKSIKVSDLKVFEGLRLRYEYLKPKAFYAGVDLCSVVSIKGFNAKYHNFHFPKNNNITGFSNLEFRLGYTFAPKNQMLTPFLGLGSYYFANYGHHFHFRESMVYYAAGIRSLFDLNQSFSLGLNLKVFRTDDTEQKFKYLFMGHKIKHVEHDNMWGGEIGVPCMWHIGSAKKWKIQLEPYFLKLDFSEVQNIYGTRLLFGYLF